MNRNIPSEGLVSRLPGGRAGALLLVASTAALYFELVVIRYLASEIRVFAYLKNMPLIASFFGIGLGMILGRPRPRLLAAFPLLAAVLFLLIANASRLSLTHLPMPTADAWHFGYGGSPVSLASLIYVGAVLFFLALVVALFLVLGGLVGCHLKALPALQAYGVNLLGSLAGILLFTALSFLSLPPWVWLGAGFLLLLPFFARDRRALAVFALVVVAVALARPQAMWSPYYRVTLEPYPSPPGWPKPSGYALSVNHDYFQRVLDLSPEFVRRYPSLDPYRKARPHYELPYRLVPAPHDVLVVGAGTGNDVAAALRNGAGHVDAVEIDPLILQLGRLYHPEHPYASPRVTVYNDDARAFFKKAKQSYDLIVFGYLDSHTLFSSYSSVRLENNVYTLQSLQEARRLLRPGGTMALAFASGESFVTHRLDHMLTAAFGVPPATFWSRYDGANVLFVEGAGMNADPGGEFPEVRRTLQAPAGEVEMATDQWPFLFLVRRTVPASVWLVLVPFVALAAVASRRGLRFGGSDAGEGLHMFFLGAGFLLLETKGVTELALLFGATWITNTVVIAAFLVMGMAANVTVMFRPVPYRVAYAGLFLSLAVTGLFPFAVLDGLPPVSKVLAAGLLTALPVFFSGLVFSRSFERSARPSEALGMNLLGAVVGGALENLVMVGGTPVLGVLAFLLYAASLWGSAARQEALAGLTTTQAAAG
jgi:SAM-dependent methyltransferase